MAVAVLAKPILGEKLTPLRLALALVVMVGAWLTVRGGHPGLSGVPVTSLVVGVTGGLLAAASYAGTTILARWAVPRYGTFKVLFWEIGGGTLLLALLLPLAGHAPAPPATVAGSAIDAYGAELLCGDARQMARQRARGAAPATLIRRCLDRGAPMVAAAQLLPLYLRDKVALTTD